MPTEQEWAAFETKIRQHEEYRAKREKEGILRAEAMGYDCGKRGPNAENSHYTFFCTPAWTRAWELGKKRAEAERDAAVERRDE